MVETAEVHVLNLYADELEHDEILVYERPVETIKRRLQELGLRQLDMARALGATEKHVSRILTEKESGSKYMLNVMLDYVGMELVAIPSKVVKAEAGHWFFRERCQYCHVNIYDSDSECPGKV